jgi:hypothetical protein
MTTPTPQAGPKPNTGNSAGAQALAASGITLPDLASGKSQFGLGTLSSAPVQVGGLFPVVGKDGAPVTPGQGGTYTAEQIVQSFASASPSTIAQIQHMLILGGFYGSSSYTPNYGVLNKEDLDAFTKATTVAAQTGGSLAEYLTRQAKFGEYQGVAAAMNLNGGKPRQIQKADPLALSAMITKEFQALTGKKPTDAERAGFIAAYNNAFTALQNSNYDSLAAAQGQGPSASSDYSSAAPDYVHPQADTNGPLGFLGAGVNAVGNAVNTILGKQDAANLQAEPQAIPGQTPGAATQQDFDPQSFAENYVRQHATADVGAHDVAGQFANFLTLLKGIG